MIAALTGKSPSQVSYMTAAEKRQVLVDKGFDAIKYKSGGTVQKVVALKPDIVKVVDAAVPDAMIPKPYVPPPAAKPYVPATPVKTSGLAADELSLADRTPSGAPLTPKPGETVHERQVREFRASFRARFTAEERARLGRDGASRLSPDDPVAPKLRQWRLEAVRKNLVDEHGMTQSQANKLMGSWDRAVSDWFSTSSSDGAAVMKLAAEDSHGINSTTFHGRYFDHNEAQRKQYFLDDAAATLGRYGITRQQLGQVYEAEIRAHRAAMMEMFGLESEHDTFKVWRGIDSAYYHSHKIRVPNVGETQVATMNSLSSYSLSRPFNSEIVLELEATLDDVSIHYLLLETPAHFFEKEREVWIIGRPHPLKRVR
jgi:hypothetical protein